MAAQSPPARGGWPGGGHAAFGAGAVESRRPGAEEGFSRCGTLGEALRGAVTNAEFCARCRATALADGDAPEVSSDAQSRSALKPPPDNGTSGRSTLTAERPARSRAVPEITSGPRGRAMDSESTSTGTSDAARTSGVSTLTAATRSRSRGKAAPRASSPLMARVWCTCQASIHRDHSSRCR